jgi:hypothetical protein
VPGVVVTFIEPVDSPKQVTSIWVCDKAKVEVDTTTESISLHTGVVVVFLRI